MTLFKSILAGICTLIIVIWASVFITNTMSNESTIVFTISALCGVIVACTIWIVDTIKNNNSFKK